MAVFNGLIVFHHLEFARKLNFFTSKVTETACTCITSPAEASVQVSCQNLLTQRQP